MATSDMLVMGPNPTPEEPLPRIPLVLNNRSMAWVTQRICGIVELPRDRPPVDQDVLTGRSKPSAAFGIRDDKTGDHLQHF